MLTGRRAFAGDDISDMLASRAEERSRLGGVPAATPASVRRLLRRCLEKDPRKRLSAIGDARLELDETEPPGVAPQPREQAARRPAVRWLWPALAGAALTAAAATLLWPMPPARRPTAISPSSFPRRHRS